MPLYLCALVVNLGTAQGDQRSPPQYELWLAKPNLASLVPVLSTASKTTALALQSVLPPRCIPRVELSIRTSADVLYAIAMAGKAQKHLPWPSSSCTTSEVTALTL